MPEELKKAEMSWIRSAQKEITHFKEPNKEWRLQDIEPVYKR